MSVEITQTGGVAVEEAPESVSSLVRFAIDKGVDVEVLERLVALQERVTERNARGAYFAALSKFQDECPEISKSKTADIVSKNGGRFSYSYAPLEEMTRTIRPALKANGLSYSWDVDAANGGLIVSCVLRHIEGHSERAHFPVPVDKGGRMSDAQANGAALTYGKRQSLASVLGLTTADPDTDGVDPRQNEGLTDEQLADLTSLMDEVKADRKKFLEYMGAETVAGIRQKDLNRAIKALEKEAEVIIHTMEQGTEEWAKVRVGLPTCSQLDKILSPKKLQASAQAVGYRNQILAEWLTGYPQDWGVSSPWMERGRDLEPEARAFYAFDRSVDVDAVGFATDDAGEFGGSPDGLVGEDGILEIKCPALHTHIGYMLEPDSLTDAYRSQVQGYLYLTGRKWADLMSYNPDLPPVTNRIEPDAEYIGALSKILPAFIRNLNEAKERLAPHRFAQLEAAA